jgi:staphylococcal nuclease domain-containing protein 1
LASELLKNGWAKLKDIKREPTEEDLRKRELETEAKLAGKGLWNPHGPQVCPLVQFLASSHTEWCQARVIHYTMPADSQAFVTEWKGKSIDGD